MFQWLAKNLHKDQKGFTLVELLVVITILGILATLAVQVVGDKTDKAKLAKVKADLRTIVSAAEIYRIEEGKYPDAAHESDNIDLLVGGYLKKIPSSPISGQEYGITDEGYAVLWNGDGNVIDSNDIYTFTSPESFTCSSENL